MSQEKVDRYKKEKKNRAKTMKLNKIKKAVGIFVAALGLGAIIGIPLGRHIYKVQKEEAEKHKTISASSYETWFADKWDKEYASLFTSAQDLQEMLDDYATASDADAEEDDAIELDADDLEDGDIEIDGDDLAE